MKHYTMNKGTSKPTTSDIQAVQELARDENGRLYSVRMRELFDPLHIDMSVVEAMAALRIAGRALHHLQEKWAERYGLTEGRMGVLFRLLRCGSTPLGDLASDLNSTPRNITGLVDHLERDGLVERVPDPDDRRSVRANLTEAGRVRIESIWKEGLEHQHEIADGLSKEDLAQLRHLCLQLVDNARKELGK
ncbi:MAG: MarR family winged helix-turn-helix transcriptional regulator [Candidatus Dormibacteraceae bacterium]